MSFPILYLKILDKSTKKVLISLLAIILLTFSASIIQSDYGNVKVKTVEIVTNQGQSVVGKLYLPSTATNNTPAPAVLLLHGLNNDKDTEAPTAIELSRRGFVALALDEAGHGDSERGDSLLESVDETLGGNAAYHYLKSLEFVSDQAIGLVGHSMGGGAALEIARLNPDHQAIALQAFPPQNLSDYDYLHNYLQIWPRYEESEFTDRDSFLATGQEMIQYNLELNGFTMEGDGTGTTYGSFLAGTAQRYALVDSTHPGGTWKSESVKEVVAWMKQALAGLEGNDALYAEAGSQVYYLKEIFTLLALLVSLYSIIPLVDRLVRVSYFRPTTQEMPQQVYFEGISWWRIIGINAAIGGISFLFIPQIGLLLTIVIPGLTSIFSLAIANAFLLWFVVNAAICHFLFRRWYRRQEDLSLDELGGISKDNEDRGMIITRSVVLSMLVLVYLYLVTVFVQSIFQVELRYMWPFFRILQPYRVFQFLIYLIPVLYFFMFNGGYFLFGQARPKLEQIRSNKGTLIWWGLNLINMLSVLFLIFILEYIPMFLFGTAPLLGGLLEFWWLFGIFLMQIIPEFMVIFLLQTLLFRRTGRIYIGSIISALIVTWVIANGALA